MLTSTPPEDAYTCKKIFVIKTFVRIDEKSGQHQNTFAEGILFLLLRGLLLAEESCIGHSGFFSVAVERAGTIYKTGGALCGRPR